MSEEKREKPYFLRRVIAYLIDTILVTLLATAISLVFLNNTSYSGRTEELLALTKNYSEGKITIEEYSKEFDNLNYYLTKEGIGTSIVSVSVAIVYYVILCYYCHGITLGKYIMKLRIVHTGDKELNMGNYLIRSLFINLVLSNLVSIIFVLTMNKDTFISIYPKVSNVLTMFLIITILFIMYRNDGRGLHDIMSNTIVVSTKKNKDVDDNVNETIKEATVIEEKKPLKKKDNNKKKEAKK